jgi:energy-coupling factor transport system substrate-specific component
MFTTPRLVVIALCAALNFSIGSVVYLIKLPIYLDSIGTILCALLLAPDRKASFLCAWAAAWMSLIVSSFVNPFLPWFALTDIAIAAVCALVTIRAVPTFRARPMNTAAFAVSVVVCGVLTGIAAAVASAPVVVYLFGGVTGSGSAFVVAFFLKTGQQLMGAALLSGLAADPVDKVVQVLIAALLYRATPAAFIDLLRAPAGEANAR